MQLTAKVFAVASLTYLATRPQTEEGVNSTLGYSTLKHDHVHGHPSKVNEAPLYRERKIFLM